MKRRWKNLEKELTVLLIEDDTLTCKNFRNYIDKLEDVILVGITNNSYRAIEYVSEYLPDAVILDLELNNGLGNGLTFLKDLKALNPAIKPYILITTNNSSSTTYNYTREMGADFIMYKHQSDYSEKNAVDFLIMLKDIIRKNQKNIETDTAAEEPPIRTKKRMARLISNELDLIGISPKAIGYKYLMDAIQIASEGSQSNICSIIAAKHGKTDASVERAMQNAINKAWRTNSIEELLAHYRAVISSEKGVPTLTEFIYYYANKINNED